MAWNLKEEQRDSALGKEILCAERAAKKKATKRCCAAWMLATNGYTVPAKKRR